MRFSPKKLTRLLLTSFITLGMVGTLLNSVHAKRRHYRYRIHRHIHHRKRAINRYGEWKKVHRHGKLRSYWYRFKTGYYHNGHWIKYHHHSSHRHAMRVASVNDDNQTYHYSNNDLNRMDNVSQMEYETVKMINVDRAAHNLFPLRETVAMKRLARKRAHQSAQLNYLTHKDPQGYNYYEQDAKHMKMHLGAYSGENIASAGLGPILMDDNPHVYNNSSGTDMANMDEDEMVYHDGSSHWGHRYNTLNSHYTSVGVGAERKAGTNNYYLAENFSS